MAPTDILRQQISAVLSDIGADVVKTGMLPTPEVGAGLSAFSSCLFILLTHALVLIW